jgi:hypothetical protein
MLSQFYGPVQPPKSSVPLLSIRTAHTNRKCNQEIGPGIIADDVRDGKFVLPIGCRIPLRDAVEAHVLGEKGGVGKILLLAPDSQR